MPEMYITFVLDVNYNPGASDTAAPGCVLFNTVFNTVKIPINKITFFGYCYINLE